MYLSAVSYKISINKIFFCGPQTIGGLVPVHHRHTLWAGPAIQSEASSTISNTQCNTRENVWIKHLKSNGTILFTYKWQPLPFNKKDSRLTLYYGKRDTALYFVQKGYTWIFSIRKILQYGKWYTNEWACTKFYQLWCNIIRTVQSSQILCTVVLIMAQCTLTR